MAVSYTLDQYVNDLRAITAKENDPVKITDLVAPLAKKFAQSPGWFRPEYRECDAEQGFGVHMLHEEPNHDLAVFLVSWLPNRGTTRTTTRLGRSLSVWRARRRRSVTTGSMTALPLGMPTLSAAANK
jgi:hypothetical protein